jgi:pimeloyl-ACP methyl ester carboxylesterase
MNAVSPSAANSTRAGNVYLIRGWRDLWSGGIDNLAAKLRHEGLHAETYRAAQWHELAATIDQNLRSSREPLVLIGFSYGADDAIEVSKRLHRPIDLLIAIDPVTPPSVPANVKLCYDFYETNGFWDIFPWLRGIPLKSDAPAQLININLRKTRPDLIEPNTAHSNIAANPKLHREIIERVLEVCAIRPSTRP